MDFNPYLCVSVFHGPLLVIIIMIDSRGKCNCKLATNFRVRVILKSVIIENFGDAGLSPRF